MRLFIRKVLVFFFLAVCFGVLYFFIRVKSNKICFLSNSVCYNAKAKFIQNNTNKLIKSKFVVLGSSMVLNNIDGQFLEKHFSKPVFNIGSWGMKIEDFKDFPIQQEGKILIINTEFPDFEKSQLIKKREIHSIAVFRMN